MAKISSDVFIFMLAGGSGTRFWPLSRKEKPKQFLPIFSGKSMLQLNYSRFKKMAPEKNIYIITCSSQVRDIKKQLPGIRPANIITEPEPKGTAAAIALGAAYAAKSSPEGTMIIVPADQHVKQENKFYRALKLAIKAANARGALVTLGVKPNFPATGYGYLEYGARINLKPGSAYKVRRFIEKPDIKRARRFYNSGRHYFNIGMFIWRTDVFLNELKEYKPDIYKIIKPPGRNKGIFTASSLDKYIRSAEFKNLYGRIKPISVDYALMQKSKNILSVKADFDWSDVGSLASLEEIGLTKKSGNTIINALAKLHDVSGSIVYGQKGHLVAAVGLNDIIIVQTADVTLVISKKEAQKVRDMVADLKKDRRLSKYT